MAYPHIVNWTGTALCKASSKKLNFIKNTTHILTVVKKAHYLVLSSPHSPVSLCYSANKYFNRLAKIRAEWQTILAAVWGCLGVWLHTLCIMSEFYTHHWKCPCFPHLGKNLGISNKKFMLLLLISLEEIGALQKKNVRSLCWDVALACNQL